MRSCYRGVAAIQSSLGLSLFAVGLILAAIGCGGDPPPPTLPAVSPARAAVQRVFDVDHALSVARNAAIASDKSTPNVASAFRQYVRGMQAVDFTGVPDDVHSAWTRHLEDWQAAAELFDHYCGLGGAFRVGVDGEEYAKTRLNTAQKNVEVSWNALTEKAKAYGVTPLTQ